MSTNEHTPTDKPDVSIYTRVTSAIVNAIEAGAGTYRMPWTVRQDKGFSPLSVGSGKPYHGINTLVLWSQAQTKGYNSALWGTYQQWQDLGAQVCKGRRGSPVVYWGTFDSKQTEHSEESDGTSARRLFAKGYTVFSADQVDGLKMPKRFEPKLSQNERIARAESFFAQLAEGARQWQPCILSTRHTGSGLHARIRSIPGGWAVLLSIESRNNTLDRARVQMQPRAWQALRRLGVCSRGTYRGAWERLHYGAFWVWS